ncbi:substrate-binding domain-containing protein [Salipiger sp. P9]|uniref:substrate-binding domain-containing protein n=1 Tax=Salipiger pentaromativorans TaxID=2943193 RepID=UPI0021583178|nr:substrate-binding domain-containing protein [Salipiger pentaromativorans]MCR8547065.1 substrate-binding domain-containing protein [Salipiger pentaromativorans]
MPNPIAWISGALLAAATALGAQADTLKLYGPGGPTPAMKEVAAAFEAETGHDVQVTAGPASRWMDDAKADADLIYSGSENMMTAFFAAHGDIVQESVVPLYMRPSAILVRKGNPDGIAGLKSLLEPGMKIMVVQGAGQVGMWEDAVGRMRSIADLRAFRDNIAYRAPNSGAARERWKEDGELDAWLIWNHWQIDNPDLADLVAVEPELAIYRDTGIGLTTRGAENPVASAFLDYVQSDAAAAIFAAHGWQHDF